MVCLRNICINTLHKGENDDDDDDDDDDDNNNNIFTDQSLLKTLCSVHHFRIKFALNIHSN